MAFVEFPDGTVVIGAALADRLEANPDRDFGLYLDDAWRPTWDAVLIDWPDFGLPKEPHAAARAIQAAFLRAKAGERLEVGCLGGKGRTGTTLACMAILAGVEPLHAVEWVRAAYRPDAVEGPEQEAWTLWFAKTISRPDCR